LGEAVSAKTESQESIRHAQRFITPA
jgi:hypothetical protein